jgi:hypothetical protein
MRQRMKIPVTLEVELHLTALASASPGYLLLPQLSSHKAEPGDSGLYRVILATWETEIRRIMVGGQSRQGVHKTPFQLRAGHSGMCLTSLAMAKSLKLEG